MIILRNAIVTLSLGAALVAPAAASASSHNYYGTSAKSSVSLNHDQDDHEKKTEKEVKKSATKTSAKSEDKDDYQKSVKGYTEEDKSKTESHDKDSHERHDKDDHQKSSAHQDCKPKPKTVHKPTVTPAPVAVVTFGKGGDAQGVVLSAATTPVVKTASTLPVTGPGTDIALAVAAASAFGAYMVSKRRRLNQ